VLPDITVTCSRLGSQPPKPQGTRHPKVLAVAQGGTPTPQRAGRQKAAAAQRGIKLISASGKLSASKNPSDLLPLHIVKWDLRQIFAAKVSRGRSLSVGSRARQSGGQPPDARFVTEGEKGGFVGISLYPAMASVASMKRGGKGQAWLGGCGNERRTG
jgi:hypothetical protein